MLIHPGAAQGFAFPATGINQPAGGQLDAAIGQGVVNNFGLAGNGVAALLLGDGGVFKKTARIANLRWIGQLGTANGAHPITHLLGTGLGDAQTFCLALQLQVAQLGLPLLGQGQAHLGYHRLACQAKITRLRRHMFKHRITVGKSALGRIQGKDLPRAQIDRIQAVKAVLQLHPVGPNVLHGGCAHGAGDQGQIL